MTKIKLVDGTIINVENVDIVKGTLKIVTTEKTVEELHELFSNKENTARMVLMTESEVECGYQEGFTSFAGIEYDVNGVKTVNMFQPVDVTEARLSKAEGHIANVQAGLTETNAELNKMAEAIQEGVDAV